MGEIQPGAVVAFLRFWRFRQIWSRLIRVGDWQFAGSVC